MVWSFGIERKVFFLVGKCFSVCIFCVEIFLGIGVSVVVFCGISFEVLVFLGVVAYIKFAL